MPGAKKSEVLLQSIVPAGLAVWARGQAKNDGVSVSAWLRRLLMRERAGHGTPALAERIDRLEREVTRLKRRW